MREGCAPQVVLEATSEKALDVFLLKYSSSTVLDVSI